MRYQSRKKVRRESRKHVRHYVRQGARIMATDGTILGACVMHDISVGGACLELKSPGVWPDHFILLLSHDGRLRRQCAVVWRTDATVGVEFMPDCPAKES